MTKGRLLRAVWGEAYQGEDSYVYVHVSQLRRKLAAADPRGALRDLIVTEPGVGYRVRPPDLIGRDLRASLGPNRQTRCSLLGAGRRLEVMGHRTTVRRRRTSDRTLDRELGLIRDAIALVARGGSPRVVVGSLRFGDAAAPRPHALAHEAGVRLVPALDARRRRARTSPSSAIDALMTGPILLSSRTTRASARSSPATCAARATPSTRRRRPRTAVASLAARPATRRSSCSTSTCRATPAGTCCAARAWRRPARRPSSIAQRDDRSSPRRLAEFGVAGYLPKPFPLETLASTTLERPDSQRGDREPSR